MLNNFTIFDIQELQEMLDRFYVAGTFPHDIVSETIQAAVAKKSWGNMASFRDDLFLITESKSIAEAQKKISGFTSQLQAATPSKDQLEQLEKDARAQEQKQAKATTKGQKEVEQFIKQQKIIGEEAKKAKGTLKDKKVVIVPDESPEQISLTAEEKGRIFNLAQAAVADSGAAQKAIEEKIQDAVDKSPPEVKNNFTKQVITRAATDLLGKAKAFGNFEKPEDIPDKISVVSSVSLLTSASNPNDLKLKRLIPNRKTRGVLAKSAQALALSIEAENNINFSLISPLFPDSNNIPSIFYPQQIAKFHIAKNQAEEEGGMEINLEDIYDQGRTVRDIWYKLATKTTTVNEAIVSTTNIVPSYTPPVNISATSKALSFITTAVPTAAGAITGYRAGVLINYYLLNKIPLLTGGAASVTSLPLLTAVSAPAPVFTQYWNLINGERVFGGLAQVLTKEEALAEISAAKIATATPGQAARQSLNMALGNAVAKGASAIAARLGFTAASAKLGAMVGTGIIPVIGTIIGFVLGALLGKAIEKIVAWAKKHKEDLAIIGGVMMAGGLLFRSIPLVVFGALTAIPGLMFARPFAGIAARAFFFGRAIGKSLAITVGTPVIVAIVVFPILVALILFIINSGAYVVPPLSGGPHFESPYIGVKKTANPPGPFQNSELPLTIEYTITITAKKGTLTNIHFSESCQVIKKGASVSCPAVSGSIPQPPDSISPTAPFSFSYSVIYPAGTFEDSLVVNSFTVTADTAEASGIKTVSSASVKIGNPPESCPNNAWPVEGLGGLNNVTQGPSAQGCTHENLNNAIDVGVDGAVVKAVHSGIATVGEDSCVGKYIKVSSTCGSVPFNSYYGHLGAVSATNGQHVAVGQALGISDNTGSCTNGPHLHFSFQTSSIPIVQKPYLIRNIPIGCCNEDNGIYCNP